MKTVKHFTIFLLVILATNLFGQYTEGFTSVNKGILQGPCGATSITCTSFDFGGVDWFINGNLAGIDNNDFVSTDGSDLSFEDVDEETCFETPILDISAVAGTFSLSVDLVWTGFDSDDYIDVEYQIDGGAWVQIPNTIGGGDNTIEYSAPASNISGSTTISQPGLTGVSSLSIRICTDFNLFGTFENVSIDNVSVPEVGAMVLPVKWAEFNVRSTSKGNQLNWATYTEVNNEKFDIEKSIDGTSDFIKIGSIDGVGTSTKTSRYGFLDRDQSSAVSYYRIKQVDFDGHFEYSEIVMVQNKLADKMRFTPNPFSSQILISMNQQDLIEGTSIRMYDNQGQLVLEKEITNLNVNDPIDTAHLSAGMYSIQYSNGEVVRLVKF